MMFIILLCLSCCKREAKVSKINYWYKTGFFASGKMRLFSIDTIFENSMIHSSKPENMLIYRIDSIVKHREMWSGEIFSYANTKYNVKRAKDNTNFANDTLYCLNLTNENHYMRYYLLLVSKHNGVYGYRYKLDDIIDGSNGVVFLQKSMKFVESKILISKLDSSFILDMFWKYNQDPDIF